MDGGSQPQVANIRKIHAWLCGMVSPATSSGLFASVVVFATWQRTSEDSEDFVQCVIGSGHAYPLCPLGAGGYSIKPFGDSKHGVFG